MAHCKVEEKSFLTLGFLKIFSTLGLLQIFIWLVAVHDLGAVCPM